MNEKAIHDTDIRFKSGQNYEQRMAQIDEEAPALAASLSDLANSVIVPAVTRYRAVSDEIAGIKSKTIKPLEDEQATIKAEVEDAVIAYREQSGFNWQDDNGFAKIVEASESFTYDKTIVDRTAAVLTRDLGRLEELVEPTPKTADETDGINLTALRANPDSATLLALVELLVERNDTLKRNASVLVESSQDALKALAGARKDTHRDAYVSLK